MSVIPLTVFFSLLLAGLFIALFVHEQRRRRFASAERDSLLPLAEETPQLAAGSVHPSREPDGRAALVSPMPADHDHDDHDGHDHAHEDSRCGCRDGSRPPCVGCLKRLAGTPAVSP